MLPPDAVALGLATSLHVNASPLAPGCGLLLSRVLWYDIGSATEEMAYTPQQLADMDAFKREVLYPHVHGLYQAEGSELTRFLQMINEPTSDSYYNFSPLRRPSGATGTNVVSLTLTLTLTLSPSPSPSPNPNPNPGLQLTHAMKTMAEEGGGVERRCEVL